MPGAEAVTWQQQLAHTDVRSTDFQTRSPVFKSLLHIYSLKVVTISWVNKALSGDLGEEPCVVLFNKSFPLILTVLIFVCHCLWNKAGQQTHLHSSTAVLVRASCLGVFAHITWNMLWHESEFRLSSEWTATSGCAEMVQTVLWALLVLMASLPASPQPYSHFICSERDRACYGSKVLSPLTLAVPLPQETTEWWMQPGTRGWMSEICSDNTEEQEALEKEWEVE